jgi:hypothetical protein
MFGNYMVDKADCLELDNGRQAGADLKMIFPNINIPDGLTLSAAKAAEQMILDWEIESDCFSLEIVLKVFEFLTAAVRANQAEIG